MNEGCGGFVWIELGVALAFSLGFGVLVERWDFGKRERFGFLNLMWISFLNS